MYLRTLKAEVLKLEPESETPRVRAAPGPQDFRFHWSGLGLKEFESLTSSQVTLMSLGCGSHFQNFAIQKKGTLNREASDS